MTGAIIGRNNNLGVQDMRQAQPSFVSGDGATEIPNDALFLPHERLHMQM